MPVQIHLVSASPEHFTFVLSADELQKFCDFAGGDYNVGMWVGSDYMTVEEFKSCNDINLLFT